MLRIMARSGCLPPAWPTAAKVNPRGTLPHARAVARTRHQFPVSKFQTAVRSGKNERIERGPKR